MGGGDRRFGVWGDLMERAEYKRPPIYLRTQTQVDLAIAAIKHAPLDEQNPLEVIIREQVKGRKQSQNAAMWAGIHSDFAAQAWVNGRQFDAETWHEYFKKQFLPEAHDPRLDKLVKDPASWEKWREDIDGELRCVGSTTKLSKKGMAEFMRAVEGLAMEYGVQLSARAA